MQVMNRMPLSKPSAGPIDGDNEHVHAFAREIGHLSDGFTRLAEESLSLAKLEAGEAVRRVAVNGALGMVFTLFAAIGHALACVAGALALVPIVGSAPLAFVSVGGGNALLGAIGGFIVWRRVSAPDRPVPAPTHR